jgi:hypothetical protein
MIAPPMWPGFASDAGHRRLHDQALEHQAEGATDNRSRMRGGMKAARFMKSESALDRLANGKRTRVTV